MTNRLNTLVNRRSWIAGCIAFGTVLQYSGLKNCLAASAASGELETYRVKAVVKTEGEVRLKSQVATGRTRSGQDAIAKTAPLKATTTVEYEENLRLEPDWVNSLSYLHVLQAESEVQVDRNLTKTKLRDNCTEIIRTAETLGLTTACLDNPLFAAERGILELPINSMFLDSITTDKKVKVTEKWDLTNDAACRLLNLDAVLGGTLTVCLVDATPAIAHLEIKGTVSGSVRQVANTIQVHGKAHVDRESHRVTWLAANIEETREISEQAPGFKVMAQIELRRAPIDAMATGETLETIAHRIPDSASALLQQFHSNLGYYRFLANRNWITFRDNGEEATYRYIVDNHRTAQCNVTNMVNYEPGRQLSLEGFVSDVRKSIGSNLSELIESSENVTSSKMRALRVLSRGSVEDVDIIWIHYHLSNDNGRRATVVFMLNAEEYENFGAEDSQIINTFELIDWPLKLDKSVLEQADASGEKKAAPEAKTSAAPNRFQTSR